MGEFSQAFRYWLTAELVPERHVELLRVPPPPSRNIVPRADGDPSVCVLDKSDYFFGLTWVKVEFSSKSLIETFFVQGRSCQQASKYLFTECLKVSMLLDILMSKGTVFQSLAADSEKEFSNRDVSKLGICND